MVVYSVAVNYIDAIVAQRKRWRAARAIVHMYVAVPSAVAK